MAKRGRPKAIDSPETLWGYFQEYKAWVKANPFKIEDWVGGAGKPVIRTKEKPLTMEGFEVWLFKNTRLLNMLDQYFANRDGRYSEYVSICKVIRNEIREDQISGGMSGLFNPSITQRLNNLKEQTETTTVVHTMNLGK